MITKSKVRGAYAACTGNHGMNRKSPTDRWLVSGAVCLLPCIAVAFIATVIVIDFGYRLAVYSYIVASAEHM